MPPPSHRHRTDKGGSTIVKPTGAAPLKNLQQRYDTALVVASTAGSWALSLVALYALDHVVAPFDSSHLVGAGSGKRPGLRWDAIHFVGVATGGYVHEQQLAFQPGWHGLLRLFGSAVASVRGRGVATVTTDDVLAGALLLSLLARVVANLALYHLTRTLFGRRAALTTSLLYALPPAPATLCAPYTESVYAAFFFSGLYATACRRYVVAALLFAGMTSVRATGVFAGLVLAWQVVVVDLDLFAALRRDGGGIVPKALARLVYAAALYAIIVAPFLAFQAYSYLSFCVPTPTRPWCSATLPFAYSFVQREYWNVGPFRYWTLSQLPNFAMAGPVLYITLKGLFTHLGSIASSSLSRIAHLDTGIYLHQLLMMALLIVSSHTQIALRLAATDPVVWWTVAASALGNKGDLGKTAKVWLWWVCIWGAVSLVLWSGHYPPA
ncbi:GPI mannosyltransferase 2 [Vanrija pseudolonga]|uniref:GPI mannosyltransferase 2 n=1 Tax=Vanrija pseudolonga TaxID=143232 RepID=A0AAF0YB37_9TREE|nr:GPI mannosyltransferase 2 [Vanrija pseudolonga]